MSRKNLRRSAADAALPTVASLSLRAKLITEEEDTELKALIERYEQLLCDWEDLSHRTLKALAARHDSARETRHAVLRA